jgi:hypothetical protein
MAPKGQPPGVRIRGLGRCRGRAATQPVTPERRQIAALRNVDADGIVLAGGQLIVLESAAQSPRLQTHDRIRLRVEAVIPPEDRDRDRVALQTIAPSGQRLTDQERRKRLRRSLA